MDQKEKNTLPLEEETVKAAGAQEESQTGTEDAPTGAAPETAGEKAAEAGEASPDGAETEDSGTAAEAQAQTPAAAPAKENAKPKKNTVGKFLRSNRVKRGSMATLMSVVFIAIVVVVNVLVGMLTDRFPSMNIDLTAQKLNSLSDQALEIAKKVDEDTTIYLIGQEEGYRRDTIYSSYGLEYSQVANLAEKLREANSKISVEFIDPDANPTFISQYPNESLTTGKVLVQTEKRHKVLTVSDMFSLQTSQTTGQQESFSKVDSALAGALEMVNLDKVPILTIVTGHGELLGSDGLSSFKSEMEAQNFEIREMDFLTEEIPEGTQILMLPTPTTDYTQTELEKLRGYLDDTSREEPLTLLLTCHPTQGELPNLASFLEEWGVRVETGVVAETDASRVALRSQAFVLVDPTEDVLSENQYNSLIAASSSPLSVLFTSNGNVSVRPLWTTADTAYVATEDMTEADMENLETSSQNVATLSIKQVKVGNDTVGRNVVVFGSSYVFTDTFMGAAAFGNRDYVSDLLKYATGTDGSAVTVTTEEVQTNVLDVTASVGTVVFWGLGVFTLAIPLLILIIGLAVFLKRRHL